MRAIRSWIDRRRSGRRSPTGLGSGLRALYECESLGISTLSTNGRFLEPSTGLQQMLEYDGGELSKMSFNDVTHPDDISACADQFGKLQRGEVDHFELEKRYIKKSGVIFWAHIVVTAVHEGGELSHTVGIAVDITQRKDAEACVTLLAAELEERVKERTAQLEYQTALLLAGQEASPDGIAVVDHEKGRVVSYNRRFASMWGLPPQILATGALKPVLEHIYPQLADPGKAAEAMERFKVERGGKMFGETRLLDGRTFEFYSCPIASPGGRYYGRVSYWHDASDRR